MEQVLGVRLEHRHPRGRATSRQHADLRRTDARRRVEDAAATLVAIRDQRGAHSFSLTLSPSNNLLPESDAPPGSQRVGMDRGCRRHPGPPTMSA